MMMGNSGVTIGSTSQKGISIRTALTVRLCSREYGVLFSLLFLILRLISAAPRKPYHLRAIIPQRRRICILREWERRVFALSVWRPSGLGS